MHMIKIVNGDLLKATEDVIGHQVNCMGKMGSGLALQIKNKFPKVYKEYLELIELIEDKGHHRRDLLGHMIWISTRNEAGVPKLVANLFGQYSYGRDKQHTNTDALFEALMRLRAIVEEKKLSVALPYGLGSDRGGADWNEVYGIIEKAFEGYEVTLYRL